MPLVPPEEPTSQSPSHRGLGFKIRISWGDTPTFSLQQGLKPYLPQEDLSRLPPERGLSLPCPLLQGSPFQTRDGALPAEWGEGPWMQ